MKILKKAILPLCLALAVTLVLGAGYGVLLPDTLSHFTGEPPAVPALCTLSEDSGGAGQATVRFLGVLPLKRVTVREYEALSLCPGGGVFGLRAPLGGVLVTALAGVPGEEDGRAGPAEAAGVQRGDMITAINGVSLTDAEVLAAEVGRCTGTLTLTLLRAGQTLTVSLTPRVGSDGRRVAGLLVRDSVAGIGTVTYIDPRTGEFGGLGHGVYDGALGGLVPISRGTVTEVGLTGVTPGASGAPGELRGHLTANRVGTLRANTDCGVFGVLSDIPTADSAIPVGLRGEVKVGPAEIICTVEDGTTARYGIEITSLRGKRGDDSSFSIRVTDPRLLSVTGGIVQGMSGSPIIQNGKIVGAVTHVMIGDPTAGYGIFIENMLEAANTAQKAA